MYGFNIAMMNVSQLSHDEHISDTNSILKF